MNHGLFGCIDGKHLPVNIKDLNKTIKYVTDKSQKDRCIMYHGFLSLSAEEALSQGYKYRSKWKELLGSKMNDVAKANNIKRENLEWIAAFHMKKDQSHCHLIFWDKNQEIKDPFIPKKIFDKKMEWVRGQFAKEIFHDEFKELYNIKDEALKDFKSELHPFFNDFKTIVTDMDEKELKRLKSKLSAITPDYTDEVMIDPLLSNDQIRTVTKEVMRIKDIVPSKGSLKFEYMPEDVKEELKKAAVNIILTSKACHSNFTKYIDAAEELRKIYADNPESIKEARDYAEEVILKSVSNKILKAVKQILDFENNAEESENYQRQVSEDLVMSIALMLSRGTNSNSDKLERLKGSELSKQAKIELAKKLENSSLNWGQYER